MMKDPRNLLWILPLAALLTLPLWKPLASDFLIPERTATGTTVSALSNSGALPATAMEGVYFEQSKDGVKEWLITADRLYSTENDSDMRFEDVNALFVGDAGNNEETRIRGRTARYNADSRQLTLLGKVVLQNQKGYEMQTESLEYAAVDKKIRTTSPVHVKGDNIEVSAKSLLYDTATGNYSLEGNVVCKVW
jgi:LPS export ABC transporter protein LptC